MTIMAGIYGKLQSGRLSTQDLTRDTSSNVSALVAQSAIFGDSGFTLDASQTSYTVTGFNATLSKTAYGLDAAANSFTLTGSACSFTIVRSMNLESYLTSNYVGKELMLLHLNNSPEDVYGHTVRVNTNTAYTTGAFNQAVCGNGGSAILGYNAPDLDFLTNDFTIEFNARIYYPGNSSVYVSILTALDPGEATIDLMWNQANGTYLSIRTAGVTYALPGLFTNDNQLHPYAIVRYGTKLLVFRDGIAADFLAGDWSVLYSGYFPLNETDSFDYRDIKLFGVGSGGSTNFAIDEVRITSGARYTSNYTPSAVEFVPAHGLVITGYDASLSALKFYATDSGSYTVVGSPASLSTPLFLLANSSTYALNNAAATVTSVRNLNAANAGYNETGNPVTFSVASGIVAYPTSYAVSGSDAVVVATRNLNAAPPLGYSDPYYAQTKLCYHFDGNLNDHFGHVATNVTGISYTTGEYGQALDFYPNYTYSYFNTGIGNDGTSIGMDWTLEFTFYSSYDTRIPIIDDFNNPGYNRVKLSKYNANDWSFIIGDNKGNWWYSTPVTTSLASTIKYAVSYNYTTGYLHFHLNGTYVNSLYIGQKNFDFRRATIGDQLNTAYTYNQFLDEVRLTIGVARYGASNYTPETAAFYSSGGGASYQETGFPVSFSITRAIIADYSTYSQTGIDSTLTYTPNPNQFSSGAYLVNGVNASCYAGYGIIAANSSYTQTGQSASFYTGYALRSDASTFSLSGVSTTNHIGRNNVAGSYAASGQTGTLSKGSYADLSGGSYLVTGYALYVDLTMKASTRAFTLFGEASSGIVASGANALSYTITGYLADLTTTSAPNSGSYIISGLDFSIRRTYVLSTSKGLYGISSGLNYPDPADVRSGTVYGQNGEYVGTYEAVDYSYKYDIETEKLVKILSNKLVISL